MNIIKIKFPYVINVIDYINDDDKILDIEYIDKRLCAYLDIIEKYGIYYLNWDSEYLIDLDYDFNSKDVYDIFEMVNAIKNRIRSDKLKKIERL